MADTLQNEVSKKANKFSDVYCEPCGRITIHYKPGDAPAHCCKSASHPGSKPIELPAIIKQGSANNSVEVKAPTEAELKRLNTIDRSLWPDHSKRRYISGPKWQSVFTEMKGNSVALKDITKDYCKFCGNEIDSLHTTAEKKPLIRFGTTAYHDADGNLVIQEKVTSQVITIKACPNCSLQVRKPITVRIV